MGEQPDIAPTRGTRLGAFLDRVCVIACLLRRRHRRRRRRDVGHQHHRPLGLLRRPITGDFELVEIGTAIAGSLFLPYCQATGGHIVVDLFTLRANERTRDWLDRFGSLLMAIMFLAVGWRAAGRQPRHLSQRRVEHADAAFRSGSAMPGCCRACSSPGIVALAQSFGVKVGAPTEGVDE